MKSEIVNVTIIGCSVGLRIKPAEQNREYNRNYGALLEKSLNRTDALNQYRIHNLSFSRAMIYEFLRMKDQIIQTNPDFIILNLGAVEAPNRDIPRWVSDIVFQRSQRWLFPVVDFYYNGVIGRTLRKPMVYLRLKRPWISKRSFVKKFNELNKFIEESTAAKLIILDVNAKSTRVEKHLPGSVKNYQWYSHKLEELARNNDLHFISLQDLEQDEHYPDGVHFNRTGHEIVCDRLKEAILMCHE